MAKKAATLSEEGAPKCGTAGDVPLTEVRVGGGAGDLFSMGVPQSDFLEEDFRPSLAHPPDKSRISLSPPSLGFGDLLIKIN